MDPIKGKRRLVGVVPFWRRKIVAAQNLWPAKGRGKYVPRMHEGSAA